MNRFRFVIHTAFLLAFLLISSPFFAATHPEGEKKQTRGSRFNSSGSCRIIQAIEETEQTEEEENSDPEESLHVFTRTAGINAGGTLSCRRHTLHLSTLKLDHSGFPVHLRAPPVS